MKKVKRVEPTTKITVSRQTAMALKTLKGFAESYEDVIVRLLVLSENHPQIGGRK